MLILPDISFISIVFIKNIPEGGTLLMYLSENKKKKKKRNLRGSFLFLMGILQE